MPDQHRTEGLRPLRAEELPDLVDSVFDVFGDDIREEDRAAEVAVLEPERTLGLVLDGDGESGRVVASAAIYSRELAVPGGVLPVAAVTMVGVAATHRRQGLLSAMMRRQLADIRERGTEPIAALYASETQIYGRFGYGLASYSGQVQGPTTAMALRADIDVGDGAVQRVTEEEFRTAAIPFYQRIAPQRPGFLNRSAPWWDNRLHDSEHHRKGKSTRRYVVHRDAAGKVTGYATYRIESKWGTTGPDGTLHVLELLAETVAARAKLWQHLLSIDLIRTLSAPTCSTDDPLPHLLREPRAAQQRRSDGLFIRIVDLPAALSGRRYPAPIDLVLKIRDELCPWNDGHWRLTAGPSYARCTRVSGDGTAELAADLEMDAETLGAIYLGGNSIGSMALTGRIVEHTPGAVTAASTSFGWPVAPLCPEEF